MLFCTQQFLFFFLAVFTVYWALPWATARVWLLLAASIAFYASWNELLCGLVAGTATLDYFIARNLDAIQSPRGRKRCCGRASAPTSECSAISSTSTFFSARFVP